jgi:hypothetical protein
VSDATIDIIIPLDAVQAVAVSAVATLTCDLHPDASLDMVVGGYAQLSMPILSDASIDVEYDDG